MNLGAATHTGYVRSSNEDGYFVSADDGVFAIADGMGGHEQGEIASHLAINTVAAYRERLATAEASELANILYEAVQSANQSILTQSDEKDARARMGTTLIIGALFGDRLYFAHIGDSRLYLLRGNIFTQLTRDHSLVQSMVDRGEISQDEAAIHPLRHQITRVVGGDEHISPEIASQALEEGDQILLCTDGLTGVVEPAQIKRLLSEDGSAQEKADRLVQAALQAGGPDNITAVVIDYQQPRAIPEVSKTPTPTRKGRHRWQSLWITLFGMLLFLAITAIWLYQHPVYVIATDGQGMLGLYQQWPLLPMLERKSIALQGASISWQESQPFMPKQYLPAGDTAGIGLRVDGEDAGAAVIRDIINATAAGLLEEARVLIEAKKFTEARQPLARAKALRANDAAVRELEERIRQSDTNTPTR